MPEWAALLLDGKKKKKSLFFLLSFGGPFAKSDDPGIMLHLHELIAKANIKHFIRSG
jgi:hypothetical protein